MIVFASTLRTARRPRRIPSLASVVRALGSAQVSDEPVACPTRNLSLHAPGAPSHGLRPRGARGTHRLT